MGVVLVELEDYALDWGRVALEVEVSMLEIIVELKPSLLPADLFSEGKYISEVKVVTNGVGWDGSESGLLLWLNLGLLLFDLFLGVASYAYNLNFVLF